MQANKDQDWSADDAFWDDAWADMNTRLDEAPPARRKKGLIWLALYLGVAAVFVLLLVVVARIALAPEKAETLVPAPSLREAVVAGSERITDNNPVAVATPTKASTSSGQVETLSAGANGGNSITPKKSGATSTASRYGSTESIAKTIKPVPAADRSVVTVQTPSNETVPDQETNKANDALPVPGNEGILADKNSPPASFRIAPLTIVQLTNYPGYSLPVAVQPRRFRNPNPLSLEAGFTSSFNAQQPGFLAGVGYRINTGKKLSFPLSLRYRLDELGVKDSPLDEALANDVTTGGPAAEITDPVLIPRSISTLALELETGLAWAATPRLRLTSGLSAAYQLRALVNFEGQSNRSFNGQADFAAGVIYSLRLDRGEEFISALSQDGISPDFNRWAFRAYLGATYDLTPRLGVNLKASRLLAQPDRAGVIGLRTGRLEVGVGYRLW